MLEGEYLELVNDLKARFEEKDSEVKKVLERNEQLQKTILSCYGFIRIMDFMASNSDIDFEVKAMIDILRSYLSDEYDNIID
jgi:hypothetical protein